MAPVFDIRDAKEPVWQLEPINVIFL